MALFQIVANQYFIVPDRVCLYGEVLQDEYRIAGGKLAQQGFELAIQLHRQKVELSGCGGDFNLQTAFQFRDINQACNLVGYYGGTPVIDDPSQRGRATVVLLLREKRYFG